MLTRRELAGGLGLMALAGAKRPNILWITCEDTGPQLGFCGDAQARTPNLDRLAAKGAVYRNAWSNAPVCAPARTAIITGVYPPSAGAEHMRSLVKLPDGMKLFPGYLREAGYYTSNNVKEDYNVEKPEGTWDDSSGKAHWRNRAPGQPFFSVFNFTATHESQIHRRPHTLVHDPARIRVPAYHPDCPEVRRDWAQYYDNLTTMDGQAGRVLAELESDGLAEDTIVFFFGDHGPGLPRCKRFPYNSGLNVSIVAVIPEKWRHLASKDWRPGSMNDRLVGFVDLAPTMLSLAGIKPPAWHQGQAFLGRFEGARNRYLHGFRGRMDERYDLMRSVRDERFVYIRNYMPHRIYGQYVSTMFNMPTTQAWKRLFDEGKLTPELQAFWKEKPPEELYDLAADPGEVKNLAASPEHSGTLERMRAAHRQHTLGIRDAGLLGEHEAWERAGDGKPWEMSHDPKRYAVERVFEAAELAARREMGDVKRLEKGLSDADSGVRYWSAMGLLIRGAQAVRDAAPALRRVLDGASANASIAAAEALARYGGGEARDAALETLARWADPAKGSAFAAMAALNALEELGAAARPLAQRLKGLPVKDGRLPRRAVGNYLERLHAKLEKTLSG